MMISLSAHQIGSDRGFVKRHTHASSFDRLRMRLLRF
jgi:hypothetical protein